MPGKLAEWPNWPEFSLENAESGEDLREYKRKIFEEYGEEALTRSWLKTCKALASITDDIAASGTDYVPEVNFEDLFSLSSEQKQVIPRKQADQWFQDLEAYVAQSRSSISGWPRETPFILNLYSSPSQVAARTHPNTLKVSRELNSWANHSTLRFEEWHNASDESIHEPLAYADGVRIRPPGVPFYGLGPHIGAGSLARWTDPFYRKVYSNILSGHPEDMDSYDLSIRKDADQAAFAGTAHSTVFRSFQGWTALSAAASGECSLMLYPNVKWSIAYLLLRPFFKAPESPTDIMTPEKWVFDPDTPWFPGTWKEDSQLLSPSSHPHLRLKECMVPIPAMQPGDMIFWHADLCHAVEVEHNGEHEASVAYIAATPSTEQNKKYMKQQVQDFINGKTPLDFCHNRASSEKDLVGFTGEAGILSGEAGRRAMGFGLVEA